MICSKCMKKCNANMTSTEDIINQNNTVSDCCKSHILFTQNEYNEHYAVCLPSSEKTLRDEVAIAALQGILASNATIDGENQDIRILVTASFAIADAFMEARNK